VATEFTKLVFIEKNLFAQWPPEDTKPKYMIFFSSEPCKQTWPIILISTNIHSEKFGRDHDHERYKQMKSSQNIQRLGHTKFTSCSSDFVLKTMERASDLKMLISFPFFLVCLSFLIKYYVENIFLIFFMYFQKRETIFLF
jgi:hypothetical protein